MDGEEHGDERSVRHGRPLAYGPCRRSLRRSISSSRRSGGETSSPGSSIRSRRRQYPRLRVILVDQNSDDRARRGHFRPGAPTRDPPLRARPVAGPERRARARRRRRRRVPGRRCIYAPGLLARVASRFATDPRLDGLSGRAASADGRSAASWKSDAATFTSDNLWNRAISFAIFLRRDVVEQVGRVRRATRPRLRSSRGARARRSTS